MMERTPIVCEEAAAIDPAAWDRLLVKSPLAQPPVAQPKLHRFGKRTLMHCGTIQARGALGRSVATQIWLDVTERVNFANSKYQPHQGEREKAHRLRQMGGRGPGI